jgi:hypothetical protein
MGRGEAFAIGEGKGELVGQAEVQRFIGIEKNPRGHPESDKETEQRDCQGYDCGVALQPMISVFR